MIKVNTILNEKYLKDFAKIVGTWLIREMKKIGNFQFDLKQMYHISPWTYCAF